MVTNIEVKKFDYFRYALMCYWMVNKSAANVRKRPV